MRENLPSRISKRCRINGNGVGWYSRRTCLRSWRDHQQRKKKEERAERAQDPSRTRPVTHLARPPTARVPPLYVPPPDRRSPAHIPQETRGSQPLFQVEERERGKEGRGGCCGGEKSVEQKVVGNRSGVTCRMLISISNHYHNLPPHVVCPSGAVEPQEKVSNCFIIDF